MEHECTGPLGSESEALPMQTMAVRSLTVGINETIKCKFMSYQLDRTDVSKVLKVSKLKTRINKGRPVPGNNGLSRIRN